MTTPTPASSAMTCTCPSGDGSLRHPCPVHPPEGSQPVAAPVDSVALNLEAQLRAVLRERDDLRAALQQRQAPAMSGEQVFELAAPYFGSTE